MRVWVDDWEWQCCGAPFAVGEEVEWGLLPVMDRTYLSRPLGVEVANGITHSETHHQGEDDDQPIATRGRVESIEAAYWHLAKRASGESGIVLDSAEGTGVLEPRTTADGWEPERPDGREFRGYVVTLAPLS